MLLNSIWQITLVKGIDFFPHSPLLFHQFSQIRSLWLSPCWWRMPCNCFEWIITRHLAGIYSATAVIRNRVSPSRRAPRKRQLSLLPLPCLSVLILCLTLFIYIFNTVISRTSNWNQGPDGLRTIQTLRIYHCFCQFIAHLRLQEDCPSVLLKFCIWLSKYLPMSMGNITKILGNQKIHIPFQ